MRSASAATADVVAFLFFLPIQGIEEEESATLATSGEMQAVCLEMGSDRKGSSRIERITM